MVEITEHAHCRAQQRGLTHEDIAFVYRYGSEVQGGLFLSDADCAALRSEGKPTVKRAERVKGTFIAVRDDAVTTVFRPTGAQISHRLKNACKRG